MRGQLVSSAVGAWAWQAMMALAGVEPACASQFTYAPAPAAPPDLELVPQCAVLPSDEDRLPEASVRARVREAFQLHQGSNPWASGSSGAIEVSTRPIRSASWQELGTQPVFAAPAV